MNYTAQPGMEREMDTRLFEADADLPSKQEIGGTWLKGGLAALDENGAIQTINDELAAWLGFPAGDLIGKNFGEAVAQREEGCAKKFVELWQVGGAFAQGEVAGIGRQCFQIETARTGSAGFVRIASQLPPTAEMGELAWNARLGSDAARREMYVRLMRAEAQLENWMRHWPGVIFSQRPDFSFTFISDGIKALTGISPEEWRTQPQRFWAAVHEADADELQQQFRAFSISNPRLATTYRIRHAETGRVSYVFEQRQALYSHNGLLLGYEGVWLDVTRQTIAEKRLSSAAWKETLAVLTMGLAHDFSNIMSGIMSLSEAFQAEVESNHPFQEGLALIKRNSMQATQMVQRILSLHHGKVGERNYHNLNELVKDTVEVVRKIIPRRIETLTDFSSAGLPIYVDAVEFRQVLLNLSLNAADAMPTGGKLAFTTSLHQTIPEQENLEGALPQGPAVCLSVADTGTGISPRHLKAIFDPFFTTKAMNKGSGLGLYNARLFVEKHRGAISVESRERQGTTFRLWLPQADFTESERNDSAQTRRRTLLVIGRDRVGEGSAKFLREQGYYTVVAPNGERAAEILQSPDYQFDAVFAIVTGDDASPALAIERLSTANGVKIKKILQIVGCNQDQFDTQLLARADLVLSADVPEPEMVTKLASALADSKV